MSKILFEVTDDSLETGLRGVPVGYCVTSRVDPYHGLFYHEIPVKDLAMVNPERVIYLLMQRKIDDEREYQIFCQKMKERSKVDPKVREYICKLPKEMSPMELLMSALTILGAFESEKKYPEDCFNVIAKLPEVVATIINHHAGWGETPKSNPELGYMENFVHMLNVPGHFDSKKLLEIFKVFNILHYDHGGGNLSVFVGKSVASSLQNMFGALAASMSALAGSRHGGANQDSLLFLEKLSKKLGDNPTGESVEKVIRELLANKEVLYGFGHAVLHVEDPRATLLYQLCQKYFPDHPLVKLAVLVRERGIKVLHENEKIRDPFPNVDAISGVALAAAGFDYPQYFPVLFGLSRCVGIAVQIVYERCEAHQGKGLPIVRPTYIYKDLS